MPAGWVAAAAAVMGAMNSADAASDAGGTMANSANNAAAIQKYMFDLSRSDNAPYRQAGQNALSELQSRLGLGGTGYQTRNQIVAGLLPQYTNPQTALQPFSQVGSNLTGMAFTDWLNAMQVTDPQTQALIEGKSLDELRNIWQQQTSSQPILPSTVDRTGLNAAVDKAFADQPLSGMPSTNVNYGSLLKPFVALR